MKLSRLFAQFVSFAAFCLPLSALAIDGVDLLKKVDRNLEPESYESYRKLINIEPNGTKKEFVIYSVKKGKDQTASLFLSPSSDKGRSTLRQGDNMWLYIPNVGKPMRITSLQSVTGGVFNNADIMRLDYALEYGNDRLQIHADALPPGARVIVVDDVLATGGTLKAALALTRRQGADVVGAAVLLELGFLEARAHWTDPAPLLSAAAF